MCGFGGQFESKGFISCSPDGPRSAFLETRLLLSLLYGLLFQYHLKEAQGLGDHMARLLLHQAGPHGDDSAHNTEEARPGSWLPGEVHREAACAVVQTLGRFMASYFTNQPLLILPPHSVDVLPPLHLPHGKNFSLKTHTHIICPYRPVCLSMSVSTLSSPRCLSPGAPVPGGRGGGGAGSAAVRGVDGGLCPGPASAGRAAAGGHLAGSSSGGLEDCSLPGPGLHNLLHRALRLHWAQVARTTSPSSP
uniref:Uncharacterized protein n=1 Tax=Hucho hucho TaxID=62062 RepID=A0A4W5R6V8_9TELE